VAYVRIIILLLKTEGQEQHTFRYPRGKQTTISEKKLQSLCIYL